MKLRSYLKSLATTKSRLTGVTVFLLCAFLLLTVFMQDLVFRLQEQSLFLFTGDFFNESLTHPGDFLTYMGRFLTQFFYYPVVGILIFCGVLLLVQQLTARATGAKRWYFLTLLPAVLFLSYVTQLSYNLYVLYIKDIAYSQMLGFALATGGMVVYQQIRNYAGRSIFQGLFLILLYPLAGFWALTGSVLMLFEEGIFPVKTFRKSLPLLIFNLILAVVVPIVWMRLAYPMLNPAFTYTCGAPVLEFFSDWSRLWIPLIVSILTLTMLRMEVRLNKEPAKELPLLVNGLILAGCIGLSAGLSNRDPNFRQQIRMERAIGEYNWEKAVKIARSYHQTPTRSIVMYRNIALLHTNQLCQTMFTFPDGADSIQSKRPLKPAQTNAQLLYYQYGLPNFAYRWSMELTVQYGEKVDYLKTMIRCAFLNGELNLARKYLHKLDKTLFYNKLSAKYAAYTDDPSKIQDDPEFKQVGELLNYSEEGWEADMSVEPCIHYHLNHLKSGSLPMLELSMASILSGKSVPLFWNLLSSYLQFHPQIPTHVQEAILLFSVNQQVHGIDRLPFDPAITSRFQNFLSRVNLSSQLPSDAALKQIRKDFGDTYWYYFLFVKVN